MIDRTKIVDCTLRDGGYYNDWDFERHTVMAYIEAVDQAGIDVVEIGFRGPSVAGRSMGPFAHSPDWLLRELGLPRRAQVGVMVNASDLLAGGDPGARAATWFREASDSPVSLVRVAAHFPEVEAVRPGVDRIRSLGYRIGLNLMQAAGKSGAEIGSAVGEVQRWGAVDVLYFADSLGNMQPSDVVSTIDAVRHGWDGEIGFHAHDNKGLALVNTLAAIDHGVEWADATVTGMGRGAGNARTENLLVELDARCPGGTRFRPEALFPIALKEFAELRSRHGWGPNLLYHLAATWSIHPTYVQEMIRECSDRPDRLLAGMEVLRGASSRSFSPANLRTALVGTPHEPVGSASARDVVRGREVLILARGPQLASHRSAIERFVRRRRPFTIALNFETGVDLEVVDLLAICNTTRIAASREAIERAGKPVLLPLGLLGADVVPPSGVGEVLDYGLAVESGCFRAGDSGARIPASLVAPYAIAFAIAGGAPVIHLAGFDGFAAGDRRQSEMVAVFEAVKQSYPERRLVALTPTSYPVEAASLYAADESS